MKRFTLLLFLFTTIFQLHAQTYFGQVVDLSKAPVAFATILIDADPSRGFIADIDGKFEFQIKKDFNFLQCSAIGYETMTLEKSKFQNARYIKITLVEKAYDLSQAVVIAGENPAHKIIRRAVANKKLNNPQQLEAYTCKVYNKLVGDFFKPSLKRDSIPPKGKIRTKLDSMFNSRSEFLLGLNQDKHMFLMESSINRKFKAPRHLIETIELNRISGISSPTFSAVIHSLQPFSFYDNHVEILDKNFLNPISPQSEDQYFFNLVDTIFQGTDSIYIITFTPKKGKIFDGLEGILHIHSDKYALQLIKAEPSKPGAMKLGLEQLYDRIDGQWFPIQLNITITADKYPSPYLGTNFSGKSYISNVHINPKLKAKDFPLDGMELSPNSNTRTDSIWEPIRTVPLDKKEQLTYTWLDSIGAENNIDRRLKWFDALMQGKYRLGFVDWDIFKSIKSNQVEGFRPGLRLVTNDKISKRIQLGAYGGYGFGDKKWKYNADLNWDVFPRREGKLKVFYNNDVLEPARFELDQPGELLTSRLYAARLDYIENYGASFETYFLPYTYGSIHFEKQLFQPNYDYYFQTDDGINRNSFRYTELGLQLRFAFAERFTEMFGTRMRTSSAYPSIHVDIRKGIKKWQGQYDYLQIRSAIEGSFQLRKLGESSFAIVAGWIDNPAPITKLFATPGLSNEFAFLVDEPGFRTMLPYEFLSDKYVFLFFHQDLGTLLNVHKFFRPTFSIEQNMGWGNLSNADRHRDTTFDTIAEGYFETGVLIEHLLSMNYFSLGQLGLGVGCWYRYGANAFSEPLDNFSIKMTLNFDFL